MFAPVNTGTRLGYLDAAGIVVDLGLFKATVYNPDGTVLLDDLTATRATDVPDLLISEEFQIDRTGAYSLVWSYNGSVLLQDDLLCSNDVSGDALAKVPFNLTKFQDPGEVWGARVIGEGGSTVRELVGAVYDPAQSVYQVSDVELDESGTYFVAWYEDTGGGYVLDSVETLQVFFPQGHEYSSFTVTTRTPPQQPYVNAQVVLLAGGTTHGTYTTDANGEFQAYLPVGTYTAALIKSGVVFTENNFSIEVLADEENVFNFLSDALTPTPEAPPLSPDVCTLYARLFTVEGSPLVGQPIQIEPLSGNRLLSGAAVMDGVRTYYTDGTGYAEFTLVQGIYVAVTMPRRGQRRIIQVPEGAGAASPVDLLSIPSEEATEQFAILNTTLEAAFREDL